MRTLTTLILLLPLTAGTACYTIGVEIGEEELAGAIGLTRDELIERYGVPHFSSETSDGVKTIGYGLEHRQLMSLDATTFVEFTLIDDRVTKTTRRFSRPIAGKNRAR